jgi:hypothetical protein
LILKLPRTFAVTKEIGVVLIDSFIFKENTPIHAFHFMDYGIIISLIIFSNCAFITLLFTRYDINVCTDWAVVTAKVRGA